MKKIKKMVILLLLFVVGCSSVGCSSNAQDLDPIIYGRHDVEKVYYPSTDNKVAAVVVTKQGDVYYYRANAFGKLRDEKLLFNVNDFVK